MRKHQSRNRRTQRARLSTARRHHREGREPADYGCTGGRNPCSNPLARGAIDPCSARLYDRNGQPGAGQRLLDKIQAQRPPLNLAHGWGRALSDLVAADEIEAWAPDDVHRAGHRTVAGVARRRRRRRTVQRLQDIIETALGGGRMVRRVLQPFVAGDGDHPGPVVRQPRSTRRRLLTAPSGCRQWRR